MSREKFSVSEITLQAILQSVFLVTGKTIPMTANAHIANAVEERNITEAARILKEGGLVAFPTETVYGLGANVFDSKAVARIFEVKKRPSFDPLIVHVASFEQALSLWENPPPAAEVLMKKFWPGPLTLVCSKKSIVPDIVTAGLATVAVRMPSNPVALRLIRELGSPIAAPSANLFGYTSATNAAAVAEDFGDSLDLILDGGPTAVGIESTVLKLDEAVCQILRPGGIVLEEIEKVVVVKTDKTSRAPVLESPGLLESHYAPWSPMTLMETSYEVLLKKLEPLHKAFQSAQKPWPRIGALLFCPKEPCAFFESAEVLSSKGDLREAAVNLFQAIRKLDKMHLDLIVAERVPPRGLGVAILDRLAKASSGHIGVDFYFQSTREGMK